MELCRSEKCDYCTNDAGFGVKFKICGHWMCGNCIVKRSIRIPHILGKDTMLCSRCGKDTWLDHDAVLARAQGFG